MLGLLTELHTGSPEGPHAAAVSAALPHPVRRSQECQIHTTTTVQGVYLSAILRFTKKLTHTKSETESEKQDFLEIRILSCFV